MTTARPATLTFPKLAVDRVKYVRVTLSSATRIQAAVCVHRSVTVMIADNVLPMHGVGSSRKVANIVNAIDLVPSVRCVTTRRGNVSVEKDSADRNVINVRRATTISPPAKNANVIRGGPRLQMAIR